jgi:nitrite reductase (NO-forming)
MLTEETMCVIFYPQKRCISMGKQMLEPDQGSPQPVKKATSDHLPDYLPIPLITTPQRRENNIFSRRPILSGKRWRLPALVGIVLAALLIVGLFAYQQQAGRSNTVQSNNSRPVTQVAPPAHPTYNAQAPATPQGSTVNLKLTVKEVLLSIAPGVAYHAWTFNGTVPGPVLRVRQGQLVHFTLVNDGTMPHSIDFHAAQAPWSIDYQPIAPGKSFSFTWRADYPGVFLYHCGSPVTIYHMANGMYGTIIVDPARGWAPAQEFVLVQSEFYTYKLADGSYSVDPNKLTAGNPDYVVFNGYANQYKDHPLTVKAGQRIRIFVVNAGPTLFSAFHIIGAIFSDTYADGNPANHMVGDQTVTIPPGGGTVVELTIPQPGLYPFVTHSFASVGKGAIGIIKVTA